MSVDWTYVKDDFVIIDFETTGLRPHTDRVIEIGAIRFNKKKFLETSAVDSFSALIKQDKPLPKKITEITGITDKDLASGGDAKQSIESLLDFIGDRTVLAYNAEFDMAFLEVECKRCGANLKNTLHVVCVLELARDALPNMRNHKLSTLAQSLGLTVTHRALSDCSVTLQVLVQCMQVSDRKRLYRKYFN